MSASAFPSSSCEACMRMSFTLDMRVGGRPPRKRIKRNYREQRQEGVVSLPSLSHDAKSAIRRRSGNRRRYVSVFRTGQQWNANRQRQKQGSDPRHTNPDNIRQDRSSNHTIPKRLRIHSKSHRTENDSGVQIHFRSTAA